MADFFKQVIDKVSDDISSQIDAFGSQVFGSKPTYTSPHLPSTDGTHSVTVFPRKLRNAKNRPVIQFHCKSKSGEVESKSTINMPCPPNITIADNASYSAINLGAIGTTLMNAMDEGRGRDGLIDKIAGTMGSINSQVKALSGAELKALAAKQIPFNEQLANVAAFNQKIVVNPNTNTTFEGNNVRTFSFNFKLIAESDDESRDIRDIHQTFRRFSYADSKQNSQNLILSYPPVWTIKFLDASGQENQYIPKIFSCYLTGVTSTFNNSANIYFEDGAPIECDVALTFQETRALTRTDIDNMETGNSDRGIGANGLASRQPGGSI